MLVLMVCALVCVCERHTTSIVFHFHVVVYALVNTIFRVVFFSVMVEHCLRTITGLLHSLNPHPQFVYMRLVCVQHITPIFHVHAAGLYTTRCTRLFMFMLLVCVQHVIPIIMSCLCCWFVYNTLHP